VIDSELIDLLLCEETDTTICTAHLMIWVNIGLFQPSTERFGVDMEQFVALIERVCSHVLLFPLSISGQIMENIRDIIRKIMKKIKYSQGIHSKHNVSLGFIGK
jgi:hypothetical protein